MPGAAFHNFGYEWLMKNYERSYDKVNDFLILVSRDFSLQPSFSELGTLLQNGGKLEGIKLGIEINSDNKDDQVPSGVIGRDYIDGNGDPQIHTWESWALSSGNEVYLDAGLAYIKASRDGVLLNSDQLQPIHASVGVSVVEWDEFLSHIPTV